MQARKFHKKSQNPTAQTIPAQTPNKLDDAIVNEIKS